MNWFFGQYLGQNGFLGTRASFMMDLVVTAMLVVVPLMVASIWLVRVRRFYRLHRAIQISLALLLLVTVVIFEIEVRLAGWVHRARPSPFWIDGRWNDWVDLSLGIHLVFAIPTPFLWIAVIVGALRHFPRPPAPSPYSARHIPLARLAAAAMFFTAVTGWLFYWLAFVAH